MSSYSYDIETLKSANLALGLICSYFGKEKEAIKYYKISVSTY